MPSYTPAVLGTIMFFDQHVPRRTHDIRAAFTGWSIPLL